KAFWISPVLLVTLPVDFWSVLTRRRPTFPFQPPACRFAMANPPPTISSTEKTWGGLGMRVPLPKLLDRVLSITPPLTDQYLVSVPGAAMLWRKSLGVSPEAKSAGVPAWPPQPVA